MKTLLLNICILCIATNLYSQDFFSKGYIVKKNGEKIECLIKDQGFITLPNSIFYKKNPNSEIIEVKSSDLNELMINNNIKYERHLVNIDKSSNRRNDLTNDRKLKFFKESLMLKVLIEGDITLYSYDKLRMKRFFYKKNGSVTPLQYKRYINSKNAISKNLNYLKQLRDSISCKGLDSKNVDYYKKDIVNYFKAYYKCKGINYVSFNMKTKSKGKINIIGKVGFSLSSIGGVGYSAYKVGTELEYVLPFNNNRWSLFIDPNYQSILGKKDGRINTNTIVTTTGPPSNPVEVSSIYFEDVTITYSSLELPIGFRRYFFLPNKNSIYINAGASIDIPISYLESKDASNYPIGFFFGLGYNIQKKFRAELSYSGLKTIESNYPYSYNSFSIKFGYLLF